MAVGADNDVIVHRDLKPLARFGLLQTQVMCRGFNARDFYGIQSYDSRMDGGFILAILGLIGAILVVSLTKLVEGWSRRNHVIMAATLALVIVGGLLWVAMGPRKSAIANGLPFVPSISPTRANLSPAPKLEDVPPTKAERKSGAHPGATEKVSIRERHSDMTKVGSLIALLREGTSLADRSDEEVVRLFPSWKQRTETELNEIDPLAEADFERARGGWLTVAPGSRVEVAPVRSELSAKTAYLDQFLHAHGTVSNE